MFYSFDKLILNFRHKASREFDEPGNLFLATSRESITNFLSSFPLLIKLSSPSRKPRSKFAL